MSMSQIKKARTYLAILYSTFFADLKSSVTSETICLLSPLFWVDK